MRHVCKQTLCRASVSFPNVRTHGDAHTWGRARAYYPRPVQSNRIASERPDQLSLAPAEKQQLVSGMTGYDYTRMPPKAHRKSITGGTRRSPNLRRRTSERRARLATGRMVWIGREGKELNTLECRSIWFCPRMPLGTAPAGRTAVPAELFLPVSYAKAQHPSHSAAQRHTEPA